MPVLDTTFLIDLLGGKPEALELLTQLEAEGAICTTVINALELYKGAYLSSRPRDNITKIQQMLATVTVLPIDEATYHTFGTLSAMQEKQGQRIGDFDTLIASIALCYNRTIVSRDPHFQRVPNLTVLDY